MSNTNLPLKIDNNSLKIAENIMAVRDLIFPNKATQKLNKLQFASRNNPNHYIIIVDLSSNSSENLENIEKLLNNYLEEIIISCTREGIRDIMRISVIIHKNEVAEFLFEQGFVSVCELPEFIIRKEFCESIKKMPWGEEIKSKLTYNYWIEEKCAGKPNLIQALNLANDLIKEANKDYPNSMPPLIINICEKTEENLNDLEDVINIIKEQSNTIGNTMFSWFIFNKKNEQLNIFKDLTSCIPLIDEYRNIKDISKLQFICTTRIPQLDNFHSESFREFFLTNPEYLIKNEQY